MHVFSCHYSNVKLAVSDFSPIFPLELLHWRKLLLLGSRSVAADSLGA